MPRPLVEGVYEDLVTRRLEEALDGLRQREPPLEVGRGALDPADSHVVLARHLEREIERALAAIEGKDGEKLAAQVHLANRILALMAHEDPLRAPPELLQAVYRVVPPERPATPLGSSTLLTRNRKEPALGHELAREVASADRVDALVSFVTMSGIRVLRDALESFARRTPEASTPRLRVMTTTYTGATEAAAVDWLARLPGARVKVSYDVRRTRLHAKAWFFHRDTGLSTAYVGSANLSSPALTTGHEWMVKVSAADLGHVIDKFEGAFDSLWSDGEFEDYRPGDERHARKLREALGVAREERPAATPTLFTLRPFPFQEEILERLRAEREVHGRHRNLLVAATGTGKTVVAAFDYAAQVSASGGKPRLLFLAHRRELLLQARDTFRQVLLDGAFGSLLTGQDEPPAVDGHDHLFATIQSFRSRRLGERFAANHWQYVVVDECHHLPADSYRDVVPSLRPRILLGLTATPERVDERSLLPDFDGRIAAELRLWHALERQLLVPFEYYGISDNTDLRAVRWNRQTRQYDTAELQALYTGDEARVSLVVKALRERVDDPRRMRALGFCVNVAHAEFMARHFAARGIPALAVHGGSDDAVRRDAPARLDRREVNVLFTCDLYNEGVDLPFLDTLLFLRPTSSAVLFTQQLGRGLRVHPGKSTCLVLDFIGQHREDFQFAPALGALTGVPRGRLARAVEDEFPYLPSGCTVSLDRQVRQMVLASLRSALAAARKRMAAELAELAAREPGRATLSGFLEYSGRELSDVYAGSRSWTHLRQAAGLLGRDLSDDESQVARHLGHLLHVDDPARLAQVQQVMASAAEPVFEDEAARRRMQMLGYQLAVDLKRFWAAEEIAPWLRSLPPIRDELRDLSGVLLDRVPLQSSVRPVPDWPLTLHRHYTRREIIAAVGEAKERKKVSHQQGILRLPATRQELLFVTIDKSERSFSPTTAYRDYAISRDEFHWETQNSVAAGSERARHYVEHAARGWSIQLFVRPRKGSAFAFFGPIHYVRHSGDRPISIVWRLEHPMPMSLFQEYATLTSG